MMEHNVEINGIAVNAHYREENINEIFLPLCLQIICSDY